MQKVSKYKECVCTILDKDRKHPSITFREADAAWDGGGFVGSGPGYSNFGITMRKNETEAHAVERLLSKKIKEISKEISKLEREKYIYIALLDGRR